MLVVTNVVFLVLAVSNYANLGHEKSVRNSVQALADRLADELADVHARLDEARTELEDNHKKLADALASKDELKRELARRDDNIREMKMELAQLKNQVGDVNLGKVLVAPEMTVAAGPRATGAKQAASYEGTVVSVNEEFNFVIVNLGAKNGMKEGMTLALIQEGAETGMLRLDMVDEAISAAAVLSHTGEKIKAGDRVKVS